MLVLTRKPQEKIQIGDNITITVIKTKGSGVRLGIEAPADVPVLRGELVAARETFSEQQEQPANGADQPSVSFTRVKRSRTGTVLHELLGEPGPLREMMGRRASASA